MLEGTGEFPPEASEFLHLAATASATAVALELAREREEATPVEGLDRGRARGDDRWAERAAAVALGRSPELAQGLAVVCASVEVHAAS